MEEQTNRTNSKKNNTCKTKIRRFKPTRTKAHYYAMRIKHLMTLKQKEKPPSWKNLATYWLTTDIYNYTKEFHFLMNNSKIKTINGKKHFYYKDIIDYIKNHNKNILNIKPETKIICRNILQQHTKQYKTAGKLQWKNHIPNINLEKIWKSTYKSYGQAFTKELHYRLVHYSKKTNKYMHKCSRDINPQWDFCGHMEDNLHLFIQCTRTKSIWKHYQTMLTKLTGQNYTPQQYLLTLNTPYTYKNTTKLRMTIIQIIIFEI